MIHDMKNFSSHNATPVSHRNRMACLVIPLIAGLVLALAPAKNALAQDNNPTNAPAANTKKVVPYPLDYCVVSGEKFGGDMGAPVTFLYTTNGVTQEIKFCCPMCKPRFIKNPDKYMKLIHEAEANPQK